MLRRRTLVALLTLLLTACGSSNPLGAGPIVNPPASGGDQGDSEPPPPDPPASDSDLLQAALDAQLSGCDIIDTSNCLLPFPNDHFTVPATAGSVQSIERGGTGRRVSMRI